jgi:hypothetical protein
MAYNGSYTQEFIRKAIIRFQLQGVQKEQTFQVLKETTREVALEVKKRFEELLKAEKSRNLGHVRRQWERYLHQRVTVPGDGAWISDQLMR